MPMRTAEQYEASLRALNLEIYMFGERVANPVDDPIIRPSMNAVAKTYELAHQPAYADLMTARSHLTGNRSHWLPDRIDAWGRISSGPADHDRKKSQHGSKKDGGDEALRDS